MLMFLNFGLAYLRIELHWRDVITEILKRQGVRPQKYLVDTIQELNIDVEALCKDRLKKFISKFKKNWNSARRNKYNFI